MSSHRERSRSGVRCRSCQRVVPKARECYAIPTCYVCLPPPELACRVEVGHVVPLGVLR